MKKSIRNLEIRFPKRRTNYGSMQSNIYRHAPFPYNTSTPVTTENEMESGVESTLDFHTGYFSSTDPVYTHSELEGSLNSSDEHLSTGTINHFVFSRVVFSN